MEDMQHVNDYYKEQTTETKEQLQKKGLIGEVNAVRQINKAMQRQRTLYKYYHNVLIPVAGARKELGNEYLELDGLIITPYAVVVVEVKNMAGRFTGGANDETWIHSYKDSETGELVQRQINNPNLAIKERIEAVQSYLNIPRHQLRVKGMVVFGNRVNLTNLSKGYKDLISYVSVKEVVHTRNPLHIHKVKPKDRGNKKLKKPKSKLSHRRVYELSEAIVELQEYYRQTRGPNTRFYEVSARVSELDQAEREQRIEYKAPKQARTN